MVKDDREEPGVYAFQAGMKMYVLEAKDILRLVDGYVAEGKQAEVAYKVLNTWLMRYGLWIGDGVGSFIVGNVNPHPKAGKIEGTFDTRADAIRFALEEAEKRIKEQTAAVYAVRKREPDDSQGD